MKKYKYALLLSALLIFQAVNNYIWLKADNESMGTDVPSHVSCAVSFHQQLKNIFFSGAHPAEKCKWFVFLFLSGPFYWPHLVHFLAALAAFLSQDILFWIRFSNIFYFAILVISTYLLGRKMHSPQAGLLAACFISLYPGIFGLSRKFGLDFPLIGITSLALYFLLSSDNFQSRRYSVLFGITSGLGMLVKGQFAFFVIAPFLLTAITGFTRSRNKKDCFFNLFVSIVLAASVTFIWWHKFFSSASEAPRYIDFLWYKRNALQSLYFYLKGAFLYISPLFFAAFLLGLILYLRSFKKLRLFFLSWAALPCIFFFLLYMHNNERYIFPVFPAAALITATGILQLASKKALRALVLFFLLTGLLQFFWFSYGRDAPPSYWIVHRPEYNNHRNVMDIFSRTMQDYKPGGSNIGVIEENYFRGDHCIRLSYFLKLTEPKNKFFLSADGDLIIYTNSYPGFRASEEFLANVNNLDFLIVFSRDPRRPGFWQYRGLSGNHEIDILRGAQKAFRDFKIVKRNILRPEDVYVFLLKGQ